MAYHGEYDVYSNDMQELYEAKWPRDSIYVWIGKIEAVNGFLLRATLSRPYKLRGKEEGWRQTVQTSHLRFEAALESHLIGSSLFLGPPQAPIQRFFQLPLLIIQAQVFDRVSIIFCLDLSL
jgi:hypothetical protein